MKTLALLLPLVLAGCASKIGTTVPGESVHMAIGHGYTETESVEMASHTAATYCQEMKKRPAIDDIATSYNGVVSEKTRQTADTVADVAAVAGVWLPGLGDDEDFKTVAHFRCL